MTFFEELDFWSKSIIRNYRTSKRINELIQYLLDNKNRVEIEDYDMPYIVLKIDGNLYSFWIGGALLCLFIPLLELSRVQMA